MSAKIQDFKDGRVSPCLYWSIDEVAEWIEKLGFPMYKDCFITNCVNGRKLILIDASALPDIGIKDFKDIQVITKALREMLTIEEPYWNRSVSIPPRENLGMYLERKSQTGKHMDSLHYEKFLMDSDSIKWAPPLSNHCLILPHD